MNKCCTACGAALEGGLLRARNQGSLTNWNEPGMVVADFAFIRPGVPTSANPVSAFLQGMREEPADQALSITAYRCSRCGRIELYAIE